MARKLLSTWLMSNVLVRSLGPVLVSSALAACGGATSDAAAASARPSPTTARTFAALRVDRETSIPGNTTPFTGTSEDAKGVEHFYERLVSLPLPPKDAIFNGCIDLGVKYRLTFQDANGAAATTLFMQPHGCGWVYDAQGETIGYTAGEPYYRELAGLLAVPEVEIFPLVLPGR